MESVRVVIDGRDEIAEIHVLADHGRHPKQIGRDIESALFSEFGVRIDHTRDEVRLQSTQMTGRFDKKLLDRVNAGRERLKELEREIDRRGLR